MKHKQIFWHDIIFPIIIIVFYKSTTRHQSDQLDVFTVHFRDGNVNNGHVIERNTNCLLSHKAHTHPQQAPSYYGYSYNRSNSSPTGFHTLLTKSQDTLQVVAYISAI